MLDIQPTRFPQLMSFVQVVGNFHEIQMALFNANQETYKELRLNELGKAITSADFWIKVKKEQEYKVRP